MRKNEEPTCSGISRVRHCPTCAPRMATDEEDEGEGEEAEEKKAAAAEAEEREKKRPSAKAEKWGHDKFLELDQGGNSIAQKIVWEML